ncbi:MAG: nitroreductase family protein [Acidimicrobiales bacterium]
MTDPAPDAPLGVIDALLTTRAMRRFTDEPVTDDEIRQCLAVAQQAPTGGNVQPQQYLVLTDPEPKAVVGELYRLSYERYERALGDPASFRSPEDEASWRRTRAASQHLADHLHEAPALVLFLLPIIPWGARDDEGFLDIGPLYASVYPAVQNFCVAARALGIGTALTTVIRIRTEEVRAALGIPDGYEIAALVPMGRPVGRFGQARRKPAAAVTHWQRWGNRQR